jgi:hypothetical protein
VIVKAPEGKWGRSKRGNCAEGTGGGPSEVATCHEPDPTCDGRSDPESVGFPIVSFGPVSTGGRRDCEGARGAPDP